MLRAVLESQSQKKADLEEAALMEARRDYVCSTSGLPVLIPLAGPTVPGMTDDFQQVAEGPDVPVMVHADRQSAFRYIVKLVEAVKCAGAVQLAIETEPGS